MKTFLVLAFCAVGIYSFGQDFAYSGSVTESTNTTISSETSNLNSYSFNELIELGIQLEENNNFSQAIEVYTNAIESNANAAIAYQKRGNCYIELEKYTKAIKDLSEAKKLNPNVFEIHFLRGLANYYNNNLMVAIEDFTNAINIDPNKSDSYYNRALCHLYYGDYEYAYYDLKLAANLGNEQAEKLIWEYCTDILYVVPAK